MNRFFAISVLAAIFLVSCRKQVEAIESAPAEKVNGTSSNVGTFVQYDIATGAQYCDKTALVLTHYELLSFLVKFDSSAIYQTADKNNQEDINKLFGFSDNHAQHHEYSARFGWRWSKQALRLFAYVYNKGVMSFRELGTVPIGAENKCSIRVLKDHYLFTLNDQETAMPRESTTADADGYKLFPYFGGDEPAPHKISIWIREY